jgi:DNA-directed RNA polymerase specialized sigma24 family protein
VALQQDDGVVTEGTDVARLRAPRPANAAAFEEAYRVLGPGLIRSAVRRGVPRDEAEALLNEAAIKVYRQLRTVDFRSLEAYFRTTFAHAVITFFRDRRREVAGWRDGGETLSVEELAERYDHVLDNGYFAVDRAACVERVLALMEEREPLRVIALELAFQGLSGRQMAEHLGKTPSAANEFLSQSRRLFERLLRSHCDGCSR